jgi:hypothetical protein
MMDSANVTYLVNLHCRIARRLDISILFDRAVNALQPMPRAARVRRPLAHLLED